MFKILTTSITILGCGIGFDINSVSNLPQNNQPLVLTKYSSPTLNLDPWESYRNKKHQEISDKILQKEIEGWEN